MIKTVIKSLDIENLYGYVNAHFNFNNDKNVIEGQTGSGKSTILNAILFALGYQKDGYQPQIDGQKIKDIKTVATMVVTRDGYDYELKTEVEQNWKTDKETGKKLYQGQKPMVCTFDGTVYKKNVYTQKVADLFGVSYDNLIMLFDIKTFNANNPPKWTWVQRRKLLFELLNIDEKIKDLNNSSDFNLISEDLNKGKDEIDIQKMLNSEKKGINDEVKAKDILIADRTKQANELSAIDFAQLKSEKSTVWEELQALNAEQEHNAESSRIAQLLDEISKRQDEINEITNGNRKRKTEYDTAKYNIQSQIINKTRDLKMYTDNLSSIKSQMEEANIELDIAVDSVFDTQKEVCPTCGQQLPSDRIAELKAKFESDRQKSIDTLTAKIENLKSRTEKGEKLIAETTATLDKLKAELNELHEPVLATTDGHEQLIAKLREEIANIKSSVTDTDTLNRKKELKEQYDKLIQELTKENRMQEIMQEISNLKNSKQMLGARDAMRLRKQAQLDNYIQEKVKLVDRTINEHFDNVKFLMSKRNSDNAENPYEMTCEVMYNGTPYSNQSNGEKIYSDICVSIGLQKLFDCTIPMIVDEKQSMTKDYFFDGQVIELKTVEDKDINAIRIKDIYSLADCM